MKVALYQPGTRMVQVEIDGSLESMQNLVGGYIETVYLGGDKVMVCNEEGKLHGLEPNRKVRGDMIVGNFFVCRQDGDELVGIDESDFDEHGNLVLL